MNWDVAADISTVVASTVVVITLCLVLIQLFEMKRASSVSAYMKVMDIVQDEEVRAARRFVLTELSSKALCKWTQSDLQHAEKVCHTYDTIGRFVRHSICPKELVVDSTGDSIIKTWRVLEELVLTYREERGDNFWDDYEWLKNEAMKYTKKHTFTSLPAKRE